MLSAATGEVAECGTAIVTLKIEKEDHTSERAIGKKMIIPRRSGVWPSWKKGKRGESKGREIKISTRGRGSGSE